MTVAKKIKKPQKIHATVAKKSHKNMNVTVAKEKETKCQKRNDIQKSHKK